jgi:glycogen operon protein
MLRVRDRPLRPGDSYPLGATWLEDEDGVNFVLFSENASAVDLLLYRSPKDTYPSETISVRQRTGDLWHVFVPGIRPKQLYAYRVDGPYKPEEGLRFNRNKVLIDPYAKAIAGSVVWDDSLFGYRIGDPGGDLSFDDRFSGAFVPKCVVVDPHFEWSDQHFQKRRIPWSDTVIYEAHVKGITKLRSDLPEGLRGTYAGLASRTVVDHLKEMDVTTLELMPVHHFVDDRFLVEKGLSNYWGYNTVGFFAPESRYSSGGFLGEQVNEFKSMVNELHNAGIEVIIDVVFNHTAEGNHLGPTLCFRGIDNSSYYMLVPDKPRYYLDFTGTGNTLNLRHPRVLQMVLDSLRYWVTEMHVDGFRFDLAASLARELFSVNMLSTFFITLQQDPILSRVKLIAEPWDVGPGGYQVGNFPYLWAEWNGKFRDTMRRFWRGEPVIYGELANRLLGSPDLYLGSERTPFASINYVTCHDGFTLEDLVSYDSKHNEANQLDNKDGTNDNLSWNCGFEGPTDDQGVLGCREKQKRNMVISLFISQGVPMVLGGDELSRSQRGNNNAFCQDNEISWYNWNLDERKTNFMLFMRTVIRFFKAHRIFRRARFFQGRRLFGSPYKDVTWLGVDGNEVSEAVWNSPTQTICFVLEGGSMDEVNEFGERVADDSFLILLNGNPNNVKLRMPQLGRKWELVLHPYTRSLKDDELVVDSSKELEVEGRTALVYRRIEA